MINLKTHKINNRKILIFTAIHYIQLQKMSGSQFNQPNYQYRIATLVLHLKAYKLSVLLP